MGLRQSNGLATAMRDGVTVPNTSHVRIYIKVATPMNLDMSGVQVTTDVLCDDGPDDAPTNWHVNDVMHVESDTQSQVSDYTVMSVRPPRGIKRLAVWELRVRGVVR